VLGLIECYLKAGAMDAGAFRATTEGTPQGGPLSPLLANLLLDELDRELERRGHRFVRYADDCNIYVRSLKAGQRVLASVTKYLARILKLKVNEAKSAVDRPWRRKFLGFSFTARRPNRRRVAQAALERFKDQVRRLRCYLWKQWGGRGYRELRRRGISIDLAWNTSKSAHGPWRLSRSPALSVALPRSYFDALGLPRLFDIATPA
jgi:RNA-directed DNA polymerase